MKCLAIIKANYEMLVPARPILSVLLFGAGALSGVPVKRYFEPVVQLELQFAMARQAVQFLACSHCISMAMHLKIVISPFEHGKAR